jgi:hypothetical protein
MRCGYLDVAIIPVIVNIITSKKHRSKHFCILLPILGTLLKAFLEKNLTPVILRVTIFTLAGTTADGLWLPL